VLAEEHEGKVENSPADELLLTDDDVVQHTDRTTPVDQTITNITNSQPADTEGHHESPAPSSEEDAASDKLNDAEDVGTPQPGSSAADADERNDEVETGENQRTADDADADALPDAENDENVENADTGEVG